MLSKPTLKSAFVEMVVVVASILIAFALDAWWQERGERHEERAVLEALHEEMTDVRAAIEVERAFHEAVVESIIRLKGLTASRSTDIEPDTLDKLLTDLCWWSGEANYPTGTVVSVISSGNLALIRNEELRHLIAGWPRVVSDIVENERFEVDEFKTSWMPFLMDRVYIPQLRKWFGSIPGREEGPGVFSEVPVRAGTTDHRPILLDPKFPNVLEYRLWTQDDILSDFTEFDSQLDHILSLIERELQTP
jgi:hypothetical protein